MLSFGRSISMIDANDFGSFASTDFRGSVLGVDWLRRPVDVHHLHVDGFVWGFFFFCLCVVLIEIKKNPVLMAAMSIVFFFFFFLRCCAHVHCRCDHQRFSSEKMKKLFFLIFILFLFLVTSKLFFLIEDRIFFFFIFSISSKVLPPLLRHFPSTN
jgi:hypothetical protein